MLKLERAKTWTETLTPWIQVLGLAFAGIFAWNEYKDQKMEVRVQRAVDYLAKIDTEALLEARLRLEQNEQNMNGQIRDILTNPEISQDQINTAYYRFVIDGLVKNKEDPGLKPEFSRLLGFLDQGVVCSQQRVCEEATVRSSLSDLGKAFVHTYTPYFCYLREAWNDPSIGKRVEEFYNPTAAPSACSDYYKSIKSVTESSQASPSR